MFILYQFPLDPSSCFFFISSSFGRVNILLLLSLISCTARWKLLPFSCELIAKNLFWQTTNLCLLLEKKPNNFLTYIQFHIKYINNIFAHEAHHLLEQHFQMIKKLDEQNFYHVSTMFQISFRGYHPSTEQTLISFTGQWGFYNFINSYWLIVLYFSSYFSNCSSCSCNCMAASSFLSWNFWCISLTTLWYLELALLFWNSISCGELMRKNISKFISTLNIL